MSEEIWDTYAALKEIRQEEKAKRRESVPESLTAKGVKFESKNNGAHLIAESRFDFWPGTGLWKDRKTTRKGRGYAGLMRELSRCKTQQ